MPVIETRPLTRAPLAQPGAATDPITVLIVVPSLDAGAADVGAVGLTRVLAAAGHRTIVASRAGRLDRKSTRLNSSHKHRNRMPSSA